MAFILNDYKEQLIKKHGYREDFAQDLSIMCETLIDYFGKTYENVITDALMKTKFVIAQKRPRSNINETVFDVLTRENMIDETSDIEFLKRTTSTFVNKPTVIQDNGTYKLVNTNMMVVLPGYFNSSNPDSISILAKEAMNAVKSCINGLTIENNNLIERHGLEVTTYSLSEQNGQILRKKESSKGSGLENGLNSYHQLAITRSFYDTTFEISGNDYERLVAGYLCDNLNLKDLIFEAQITKNTDSLQEVLDNQYPNGYKSLLAILDELDKLEKERYESILDNQQLKATNAKLEEHFQNAVAPLIRNISNNLTNDISIGKQF